MRPSDCWEVEKAKGRPVLNVEDIRNERFLAFGRVITFFAYVLNMCGGI